MRRLLLISPVARSSLAGKDFTFKLPVLGLLKVAALTPSSWQVSIQDEKVEPLRLEEEADIVGITAMTITGECRPVSSAVAAAVIARTADASVSFADFEARA